MRIVFFWDGLMSAQKKCLVTFVGKIFVQAPFLGMTKIFSRNVQSGGQDSALLSPRFDKVYLSRTMGKPVPPHR